MKKQYNICIDCKNKCHRQAIRCRKCQDNRRIKLIIGKNNPNFRHGKTLKKYYCIDCQKELSDYRYKRCSSCENTRRFKGKTYEEIMGKIKAKQLKNKRKESLLGIKRSKNTKRQLSLSHGGTGIPYEKTEYGANFDNALKEQVRFRDKYKCQICGCPQLENGRQLDIHHKDYNKKNSDINNLIALCMSCHRKTNYNRKFWEDYFLKLKENKTCVYN